MISSYVFFSWESKFAASAGFIPERTLLSARRSIFFSLRSYKFLMTLRILESCWCNFSFSPTLNKSFFFVVSS